MSQSAPLPSSAAASKRMRSNKHRDSAPERALRSELQRRGRRFRVDFPILAEGVRTRPDLVFRGPKVAVFVDGCFWHRCPTHGTMPKANRAYWEPKLAENVARDRRIGIALSDAGWSVVRLWAHTPAREAADAVEQALYLRSPARSGPPEP